MDLAKALNSIFLNNFTQKLENYGFGENLRFLLSSFLINNKQCVRNQIVEPDWTNIIHGVPQGTVHGTLVFISHVNDFGEEIGKSSNVLKLLDDTAILRQEKNEQYLETKVEKKLMKTYHYMKQKCS